VDFSRGTTTASGTETLGTAGHGEVQDEVLVVWYLLMLDPSDGSTINQGDHWAWKVMGFRKTKFQACIVMENSIGHGKS